MAKWTKPGDALDVSRVQQPIDHVEHKQRLHPVVGKAFPCFGEGEIGKTARMPDEAAIFSVVHGRRECCVRPALTSLVRRAPDYNPPTRASNRSTSSGVV